MAGALQQLECLSNALRDRFRAWVRLLRMVAITAGSALRLALSPAARGGRGGPLVIRSWGRRMNRALNIDVAVRGAADPTAHALVANHRSYLDVSALLSVAPCCLLAKSEVGRVPLFGRAAAAAGMLFVCRESPASRRQARLDLLNAITRGRRVGLFPEGTTTAGPGCLPFRSGFFVDAAAAGLRVQPVAIAYSRRDAAYSLGDRFLSHFLRFFRGRRVAVELRFGPTLAGPDGVALRDQAEAWVRGQLDELDTQMDRQAMGCWWDAVAASSAGPNDRANVARSA